MSANPQFAAQVETENTRGLVTLAFLALVTGGAAGVIGALFRLALERADRFRDSALVFAHGWGVLGVVAAALACGAAAAAATWMVRRFAPHAAGSGIPHVEAVLHGEVRRPRRSFCCRSSLLAGFLPSVRASHWAARDRASRWAPPSRISSGGAAALARQIVGCCSRRARARASPPPSMRRSPAPFSCWRNWRNDSSAAWPSPRSRLPRRRSRSPDCFWAICRISRSPRWPPRLRRRVSCSLSRAASSACWPSPITAPCSAPWLIAMA